MTNPIPELLKLLARGNYPLGLSVLGARVHLHWTALLAVFGVLFSWSRHPAEAIATVACYLGVILLHETGHAWVARRLGCLPTGIYLGYYHGICEYEEPHSLRDHALVAWGGVAAQLVVALPLIALARLTPLLALPFANIVVAAFGYASLMAAALNLVPVRGLDGAIAWKLVPMLFTERREAAAAKKTTRELLRRLK